MSKTGITGLVLMILLLAAALAFAQSPESKAHKVVKGDTLWDISAVELRDPFLWPEIWKENKWMANPHRIHPRQIIKIPLYLLKKEEPEEDGVPAAAIPEPAQAKTVSLIKSPVADENTLMASGYIADTLPGEGTIGETPSGRYLLGNNDIVYVGVGHSVKVGDRFYVVSVSDLVKHPVTGEKIGYVVSVGGIAEIIKAKDGETMAEITRCFRDIYKDEFLIPYFKMESLPFVERFRRPHINGVIVATGNGEKHQSMLDIVYLDKGCKDGITRGDLFRTVTVENDHTVPNGVIQVINCREHTATAVIRSSSSLVSLGDAFTGLDNN